MALNRLRTATAALILFNVVGTIVTWTTHLTKPGMSNAHAILSGTEFTAPLIFIALWIGLVAMIGKRPSGARRKMADDPIRGRVRPW
jgi:hypothetical protein